MLAFETVESDNKKHLIIAVSPAKTLNHAQRPGRICDGRCCLAADDIPQNIDCAEVMPVRFTKFQCYHLVHLVIFCSSKVDRI